MQGSSADFDVNKAIDDSGLSTLQKLAYVYTALAVVLDGERTGLHLRNHIAAPTDGAGAAATLTTTRATWAEILTGRTTLRDAVGAGTATIDGDADAVLTALGAIDLPGFA